MVDFPARAGNGRDARGNHRGPSSPPVKTDFLIVGQGLAGSLLAWHLLAAGRRVLVVDRDEESTSSKVAAGLVTPVAGSRFHLPPGLGERLDYARRFYWELEERSGETLFRHLRIARLFRDEAEATLWRRRVEAEPATYARYHAPLEIDAELVRLPHGGFEMREGGWLDLPAFLELTRQTLLERASYAIGKVRSEEVDVSAGGVRWKNVEAGWIVFCEGWRGRENRFFDWVPLRPTAGDILDLEVPELAGEGRILNKGGWLLPLGGGRFRAGSTYREAPPGASPEEGDGTAGREEVLAKVAAITPAQAAVTAHRRGLRPTIRRSQIFMGPHPAHPRVVFFNGLGSKGVLNGPWHAAALVSHLLSGTPLPEEAELGGRFL